MKRKCIFLVLLFSLLVCTSGFAQTCTRCNGYGQILMEAPPVSHFGVSRKTGDCEICGHAIFQNERHRHKICPRCNGTGKRSSRSSSSSSDEGYSNDDYENILYPAEADRVTELMKMLSNGKTEIGECETCHGTGRCPMQSGHYSAGEILDVTGPMPSICPLCGGGGYCPNYKCVNGQVAYTRPCTESEKEEINNEIKLIMDIAMKREYGDSEYATDGDDDENDDGVDDDDDNDNDDVESNNNNDNNKLNEPEEGTTIWDLFFIAIAIVIIILLFKKLFK